MQATPYKLQGTDGRNESDEQGTYEQLMTKFQSELLMEQAASLGTSSSKEQSKDLTEVIDFC